MVCRFFDLAFTRHDPACQKGYLWIQTFDYKIYHFDKRTERFFAIADSTNKKLFSPHVVTNLYRGLEKDKVEILPLAQTIIDVNPDLKGEQQPKY